MNRRQRERDAVAKAQLNQSAARRRAGAQQSRTQAQRKDPKPVKQSVFAENNETMDFTEEREGIIRPEERDGSIEMPPVEAHEHEGKPLPCPAEERETPRPRPAQLALLQDHGSAPGLQLTFSRNAVVQAVVMAEVLNRPRFEKGRRAIR